MFCDVVSGKARNAFYKSITSSTSGRVRCMWFLHMEATLARDTDSNCTRSHVKSRAALRDPKPIRRWPNLAVLRMLDAALGADGRRAALPRRATELFGQGRLRLRPLPGAA